MIFFLFCFDIILNFNMRFLFSALEVFIKEILKKKAKLILVFSVCCSYRLIKLQSEHAKKALCGKNLPCHGLRVFVFQTDKFAFVIGLKVRTYPRHAKIFRARFCKPPSSTYVGDCSGRCGYAKNSPFTEVSIWNIGLYLSSAKGFPVSASLSRRAPLFSKLFDFAFLPFPFRDV